MGPFFLRITNMPSAFAYLDESGDLGWKLHQPLQQGGSTRYFVVAIAVGVANKHRRFQKVIEGLHAHQGWSSKNEKKWATIGSKARLAFAELAAEELAKQSDLHVLVAVLHKENAPSQLRIPDVRASMVGKTEQDIVVEESKLRGRTHLAYAMMVADTLAAHLPNVACCSYCPDELNEGQRVLESIVTYRMNLIEKRASECRRVNRSKVMERGLVFADLIAGAVWEAYENNDASCLQILEPYIKVVDFFKKQAVSARDEEVASAQVEAVVGTAMAAASSIESMEADSYDDQS